MSWQAHTYYQGLVQKSISNACQCCGTSDDIEIVQAIGTYKMSLCPECQGAYYKTAPRKGHGIWKNAIVVWLVCPTHGEQVPLDASHDGEIRTWGVKGKSGNKLYGTIKENQERMC